MSTHCYQCKKKFGTRRKRNTCAQCENQLCAECLQLICLACQLSVARTKLEQSLRDMSAEIARRAADVEQQADDEQERSLKKLQTLKKRVQFVITKQEARLAADGKHKNPETPDVVSPKKTETPSAKVAKEEKPKASPQTKKVAKKGRRLSLRFKKEEEKPEREGKRGRRRSLSNAGKGDEPTTLAEVQAAADLSEAAAEAIASVAEAVKGDKDVEADEEKKEPLKADETDAQEQDPKEATATKDEESGESESREETPEVIEEPATEAAAEPEEESVDEDEAEDASDSDTEDSTDAKAEAAPTTDEAAESPEKVAGDSAVSDVPVPESKPVAEEVVEDVKTTPGDQVEAPKAGGDDVANEDSQVLPEPKDINEFLERAGLVKYTSILEEKQITYLALKIMEEGDLVEVGIPKSAERKILSALHASLTPAVAKADAAQVASDEESSEGEEPLKEAAAEPQSSTQETPTADAEAAAEADAEGDAEESTAGEPEDTASPVKDADPKEETPSKEDKEETPSKEDKEESPSKEDKEESPSKEDKEESQVKDESPNKDESAEAKADKKGLFKRKKGTPKLTRTRSRSIGGKKTKEVKKGEDKKKLRRSVEPDKVEDVLSKLDQLPEATQQTSNSVARSRPKPRRGTAPPSRRKLASDGTRVAAKGAKGPKLVSVDDLMKREGKVDLSKVPEEAEVVAEAPPARAAPVGRGPMMPMFDPLAARKTLRNSAREEKPAASSPAAKPQLPAASSPAKPQLPAASSPAAKPQLPASASPAASGPGGSGPANPAAAKKGGFKVKGKLKKMPGKKGLKRGKALRKRSGSVGVKGARRRASTREGPPPPSGPPPAAPVDH